MIDLHELFERMLEEIHEPVSSDGLASYLNEVYRQHEAYLLYADTQAVGFYIFSVGYQPLFPFKVFSIHWGYVLPEFRQYSLRLHRALIRTIKVEQPDRVIYESRLKRGNFGFSPSNIYMRDFTWADQLSHESLQEWQHSDCPKS